MHDDVLFLTKGWGKVVLECFANDAQLGALGVCGGHFVPDCPSPWLSCFTTSFNTWHPNPDGSYSEYTGTEFSGGSNVVEVAAIDGLWMCIRRSLFDRIRFDDKTYSGFHCYDTDICLQIFEAGYSVGVTMDINIVHKSYGNYNEQFFRSIEVWHRKWHESLPVIRGIKLTEREQQIHQRYAMELTDRLRTDTDLYARLHSPEYRLGHFLLQPYRLVKRIVTRNSDSLSL